MVTSSSAFASPLWQPFIGSEPRAILTIMSNSSSVTSLSTLQSPAHTGSGTVDDGTAVDVAVADGVLVGIAVCVAAGATVGVIVGVIVDVGDVVGRSVAVTVWVGVGSGGAVAVGEGAIGVVAVAEGVGDPVADPVGVGVPVTVTPGPVGVGERVPEGGPRRVRVGVGVRVGPLGVGVGVPVLVDVGVAGSLHGEGSVTCRHPCNGAQLSVVHALPSSQPSI